MPPQHVTHRPRLLHLFLKDAQPEHGHFLEYAMSVINVLVQVGFLVGSYLFLSSDRADLKAGDILFIVGSVITFVFAGYTLFETRQHWKNWRSAEREDSIEFLETVSFFIAGLIFMVGSFLYWPGLYEDNCEGCTEEEIGEWEYWGEAWGAGLFIAGSMGFVIASMLNAVGLGMNKKEAESNPVSKVIHYLHMTGLVMSQMGSVLFTVGSFLYRPALNNHCSQVTVRYDSNNTTIAEGIDGEVSTHLLAHEACISTTLVGTRLYIVGSALYVGESLLSFTCSVLKGKFVNEDHRFLIRGNRDESCSEDSSE